MSEHFQTTTTVTEKLWLKYHDGRYDEWYGYPVFIVNPGETIDVDVEKHNDGRVYYTAWRVHDRNLYSMTHMRDNCGVLHKTCGDGFAHRYIQRRLRRLKVVD